MKMKVVVAADVARETVVGGGGGAADVYSTKSPSFRPEVMGLENPVKKRGSLRSVRDDALKC